MRLLSIIIPGLADQPLAALGGRTPLDVADHPVLDRLATRGRLGTVTLNAGPVPAAAVVGMPALLGYDAVQLDLKRGPLEAAGLGVELEPDDLALRLNLVSTFDGVLVDTRAGHVSDQEAALLLAALREIDLDGFPLELHAGAGYRHLAVVRGGAKLDLTTVPPHEILGRRLADHRPKGRDAAPLVRFLDEAGRRLAVHEVNRVRVDLRENPANAAWLWGEGVAQEVPALGVRFGGPAALVAAAPLVRGLARKIGMTCPSVSGATADERSDLVAKAAAALAAGETHAFVMVHAAAVNEASRAGDPRRKVAALQRIDRDLVGLLVAWVEADPVDRRILVTSDHSTSVATRQRAAGPVPFVLWGGGIEGVRARRFTEEAARAGDLRLDSAGQLLEWFRKPAVHSATA